MEDLAPIQDYANTGVTGAGTMSNVPCALGDQVQQRH